MFIDIYTRDQKLIDRMQMCFGSAFKQRDICGAIVTYRGIELIEVTNATDIIHLTASIDAESGSPLFRSIIFELANWLYTMLQDAKFKKFQINNKEIQLDQEEIVQAIKATFATNRIVE